MGWERIVSERVAHWHQLDADEREEVASISDWLLRRKYWEAAQGFALRDDITVTIAAQAALLVLALGTDYYREVGSIIVYPSTMLSRGERAGPAGTVTDDAQSLLGEAHDRRGPILIAWDAAEHAARNPEHGDNVVFHEFAHKIDMLDAVVDGTPPLPSRGDLSRWVAVCTEVFTALREGDHRPPLDPYGATNPADAGECVVVSATFWLGGPGG
jgi:Mlc titration factor MtfA (ptsG expression regulator)